MEPQEIEVSLGELHKKVDTLTNMVEDLLTQFDDRRSAAAAKRRKVEETARQSQEMLLSMPGLKGNPMAQRMIKNMLSVAGVPDADEEKAGCGGCK